MKILNRQWGDLHDVSNVKEIHPLTLIQISKEHPHVDAIRTSLILGLLT